MVHCESIGHKRHRIGKDEVLNDSIPAFSAPGVTDQISDVRTFGDLMLHNTRAHFYGGRVADLTGPLSHDSDHFLVKVHWSSAFVAKWYPVSGTAKNSCELPAATVTVPVTVVPLGDSYLTPVCVGMVTTPVEAT